ncbi:hypothetical protein ACKFKG_01580 [Phormidesmis sp. 146-35]
MLEISLDLLRTQYLHQNVSTQLAWLVENLSQVKALTQAEIEGQLAQDQIRENQFFIEWLVPSLNLET